MKHAAICKARDLIDLTLELFNETEVAYDEEKSSLALMTRKRLFSQFKFYLDEPEKIEIKKDTNCVAEKYIIKRQQEGGCEIETQSLSITAQDVLDISRSNNSYFMTTILISSQKEHEKLALDLGMICIHKQNWKDKCTKLSMKEVITCTSNRYNEMKSWDDIGNVLCRSNNVYVIDRYLLQRANLFENNLLRMIEALINKDNKAAKNIYLITSLPSPPTTIETSDFVELFRGIFEVNSIVLKLYFIHHSAFHSREIIGDYFNILSDDSFSIFDRDNRIKRNKRVKLVIQGIFALNPKQYEENLNNISILTSAQPEEYII